MNEITRIDMPFDIEMNQVTDTVCVVVKTVFPMYRSRPSTRKYSLNGDWQCL